MQGKKVAEQNIGSCCSCMFNGQWRQFAAALSIYYNWNSSSDIIGGLVLVTEEGGTGEMVASLDSQQHHISW